MDSQAYIISLSESKDPQSGTIDSVFVEQHINSFGDLQCLLKQCDTHPHFASNIFKSLSWELFDKVFVLSTNEAVNATDQHLLRDVVSKLCEQVRPREMLLMVLEKLSMCNERFTFQLLLHAMEAVIIRSDSLDVWKQGLDATLRRASVLCSTRRNPKHHGDDDRDDESDEDSPEFGELSQSVEVQGEYVEQVLIFARILSNRVEELASTAYIHQVNGMLIGFVLNINAHIITSVLEPTQRHHYLATSTSLLMALSGDLYHIFERIYRTRHAVHRQELHAARAHFVQHYCNKHSVTQKAVGASTALTTDDANVLHNRISQSEYSAVLLAYFDHTTSSSSQSGVNVNDWSQCVHWDDLLSYDPSTTPSTTSEGNTEVPVLWNLVGIALLALHILLSTTHATTHTSPTTTSTYPAHNPTLPTVYSLSYLRHVLHPYVMPLLRSPVANPEGLQLAALLLAPTAGLIIPTPTTATLPAAPVPIFMSFLAQQPSSASYAHLVLSFYHCLPAQHSSAIAGKIFWEAPDAARLGILTAATNNTLSLAQTLVTAMAGCADSALRAASFQSLRAYLKRTEERSLFGLLLVLSEQCPYPNMAGLLIDLAKECVQAASKGESWCDRSATQAHLHSATPATGASDTSDSTDNTTSSGAALPWLQDSTDPALRPAGKKRGFPLKKILKPAATTATPTTTTAATDLADTPHVVDVDELALLRAKKTSQDPRDPTQQNQASAVDEGAYLDLRSGVTDIDADRLVEVREAMPFMWAGKSPFWSPLVLQRFLVEPLKEAVKYAEPQKILECLDILAARVNLAQAFALKCLADTSLCTTAVGAVDGVLDSYFAGSALYAVPSSGVSASFPYAYSKLRAVKEIFALYFQLKQLRIVLKGVPKSLPEVGAELDRTRVLLLTSNVEYALQHLRALCNKLYAKLVESAE